MPVTDPTAFFGKHVRNGGKQVRRPRLVRRGADANHGHREHGGHCSQMGHVSEILRRQHGQRENRDHQHGRHARLVNRHPLLHERHRNAAAIDAANNGDPIDDEGRQHDLAAWSCRIVSSNSRAARTGKTTRRRRSKISQRRTPRSGGSRTGFPRKLSRLRHRARRREFFHRRCGYKSYSAFDRRLCLAGCRRARTRRSAKGSRPSR